ncbi:MAG: T9SS type A sorting domain-containing protein [Bacteroidia bacterium]
MRSNSFIATLLLAFVLFGKQSFCQTLPLTIKASLPPVLTESSGLVATSKNSIWSHNDNSGNAELYNFDSTGTLQRTLKILNATNTDWEDLTKDTAGNFYIGDFGNNGNTRQDLKIYRIPNLENITADSVVADTIAFSYPDQFAFPPPDSLKNFDSEAFLAYNDSLYVFSKSWSTPFSGYTKLYRLPSVPGNYVAELIDSFYTGPGPAIIYSITGAGISPAQNRVILIGYKKCWLFTDFTEANFFSGNCHVFDIADLTQKEAVCFISSAEIYISDEGSSGSGQKLYYHNFQPFLSADIHEAENMHFSIFPNPFGETITIKLNPIELTDLKVVIFDNSGRLLYKKSIPDNENEIHIKTSDFSDTTRAYYFIGLQQNNSLLFLKRILRKP